MTLHTYVFTVKYKNTFDNDWQYKNHLVESADVKSAILQVKKLYNDNTIVIIDSIFSEQVVQ